MKKNYERVKWLMLFPILLIVFGCSEDEDTSDPAINEPEMLNGITSDDLDAYKGDLGLTINVRDLLKKGYKPAKIMLTTMAEQGNYDQELELHPFANIAQVKLPVEDLSNTAEEELREGIGLEIKILDASSDEITSVSYSKKSFEEGDNQINMDAGTLDYQLQDLYFTENMRYYIQLVNADGEFDEDIVIKPSSAGDDEIRLVEQASLFNPENTHQQFLVHKFDGEDNVFALYSAETYNYIRIGLETRALAQSGIYNFDIHSPEELDADFRFLLEKEQTNGLYTIRRAEGREPLRRVNNGGKINWDINGSGTIQYFRIIALDINWEPTQLSTEYLQPILPAAETSFGFNSTLRNCGSGTLEQQVGIEREITTTYSSLFSESIGFCSRETKSINVSVSTTAEASFFGTGGSVTAEVSAGVELTTEARSTTTTSKEESVSETNTFFSNRTVTVLPGTASLVYDAYQTYSNVRVPYVKRLRLRGNLSESSGTLSGNEIATQLEMTNFTGIITEIGNDYVEVTIRGNMILDNIVDTQTEVRDVEANCD
ncbi:MAG TPA: hypothetical protein VK982_10260 [Bacteroidales bacterium]|nr:hypothetical protein [Bacteroidales bacterium]